MHVIGIIGAMDEELDLYLKELKNSSKSIVSGMVFNKGILMKRQVVVVKSGLGKVQSAICVQTLITHFNASSVIFTGVAGALNPELEIGDIVISKDCIQHDIDGTGLGFKQGQIPYSDIRVFLASKSLSEAAMNSAKNLNLRVIEGRILTGDQFVTDIEKAKQLRKDFKGDCVDMEGASVAHVCMLNNIPFVIIRSISDRADHSASVDFPEFLKSSSKNCFKLVKEIVKR